MKSRRETRRGDPRTTGEKGYLSFLATQDGASGRVQRGDGEEQSGDTGQECFDWTGRRQVEEHLVLELCDLGRPLESVRISVEGCAVASGV